MKRRLVLFSLTAQLFCSLVSAQIQSPSQFLGMPIGADRTLADYRQIASYFRALDAQSPRVRHRIARARPRSAKT